MIERSDSEQLVSAANAAYYAAFEHQDVAAMAALWENSARAACTHPGWPTIHTTPPILDSYHAIFSGPQTLQFILTNERINIDGDLAYVTVDENLVDQGANASATAALNVFARHGDAWRMIVHHASPIMRQ
jgi:ketosteroid isomerase-like protein